MQIYKLLNSLFNCSFQCFQQAKNHFKPDTVKHGTFPKCEIAIKIKFSF